ncbi:hypothetical protein ACE1ET_04870 [Saccharicrinis sp. FJH62]|uniref:hypothetical protein n=1 Tax=Saccharicrinis sp. FJH62 TaxID=3344657 RepID=UPI0035D4F0DB
MKLSKIPILLITFVFTLNSCGFYNVTRTYDLPQNSVEDASEPKIVHNKNLFGLDAKYLGSLKLEYNGAPGNITKDNVFIKLKSEAKHIHGDLINIVYYEKMIDSDICYRCIADIYKLHENQYSDVVLSSDSRDILSYENRPLLNWNDFKIFLPEDSSIPYKISVNIFMNSEVNAWLGTLKNFRTNATIFFDASSVKSSYMSDYNLKHIQLIFDLAQVYAQRLESYVNNEIKRTSSRSKIQKILDEYYDKLKEEINTYSTETDYGQNIEIQQSWCKKIEAYKNKEVID